MKNLHTLDVPRKILLHVTDGLLMGIIGFAPLFMGGRHALGKLVYVTLAASLAVVWLARQCLFQSASWRRSGAESLLVAGVILVGLQLTPLPAQWLHHLSPQIAQDLTLWTADSASPAHLGTWSHVSLTPMSTRGGLTILLAHSIVFLVLVQRLHGIGDVERVLRWMAVAAIAMATLGLAQYLVSNGKFLWIYTHPFRDTHSAVKGTFANENHFAHFLALGLGAVIWWLVASLRSAEEETSCERFTSKEGRRHNPFTTVILSCGLGIVVFASLLAYSKGGAVVLLVAAGTCVGIYWYGSLLGRKPLFILAGSAGVVGVALWIHGYRTVRAEVETLASASLETIDHNQQRRKIWSANWQAIRHYPILGTGIGSHREVYPTYFSHPSDVEYTHAESGYLQVLLESGTPGLMLLIAGIVLCGMWCAGGLRYSHSPRVTACVGAVTSGLLVSVTHSVFDFVWYVPACMSLAVILAACACRLLQLAKNHQMDHPHRVTVSKVAWLALSGMMVWVATNMIQLWLGPARAAPHWEAYFATSLASHRLDATALLDREENTQYQTFVETTVSMQQHLARALEYEPDDPRANLKMAAMCLRLFDHYQQLGDNAMDLAQIRDAAKASQFPSREAQDKWLGAAIGENRRYLDQALLHTRRALRLCPLQGQGYIYLAQLAFLEGKDHHAETGYVAQALRVRPYHGAVLLAAGREAAFAGQVSVALDLWTRAFHQDADQRQAIIALLAPRLPASLFLTQFRPDLRSTRALLKHYQALQRADQAKVVAHTYVDMLQHAAADDVGPRAAHLWQQAQLVHRFLGNYDRAAECLQQAFVNAPNNVDGRFRLAMALYRQQQYEQAHDHLRWCVLRKPHDPRFTRQLKIVRQHLRRSQTPRISSTDTARKVLGR